MCVALSGRLIPILYRIGAYRSESNTTIFSGDSYFGNLVVDTADLIYGQWKQLIVGGITSLAAAYVVTDDPVFARKALLLLERVSDRAFEGAIRIHRLYLERLRSRGVPRCLVTKTQTVGYQQQDEVDA